MEKIDKILISFASVVLFLGAVYLFIDPESFYHKKNLDLIPIAKVTKKSNTVKRKLAKSLSWTEAFEELDLYEYDQIFTHDNSKAEILFINNVKLKLKQNTLIKLLPLSEDNDLNNMIEVSKAKSLNQLVELKKGDFEIDTNNATKSLNLNIKVKNKTFKLVVLKNSILDITNKLGKATFKLISGKAFTLKNGKQIDIFSAKPELENTSKINLLVESPSEKDTINITEQTSVFFKWELKSDITPTTTELIIATDEEMNNVIIQERVNSNEYKYSSDIKVPTVLYWQLSFNTGEKTFLSKRYNFTLAKFSIPKITSPKPRELILLKQSKLNTSVDLSWTETGHAQTKYLIDIVKDEIDRKKFTAFSSNYTFNFAAPGAYTWKVKAVHPSFGETQWSKDSIFIIKKSSTISKLKPINYAKKTISRPNDKVTFSWKKISTFKDKYKVEISNQRNFSNITISAESKEARVKLPFKSEGLFYWKVSAGSIAISEVQELNILKSSIPSPISLPRSNKLRPNKGTSESYQIKWPGSAFAKSYIIEIYRDRYKNKQMINRTINTNSFTWKGQRAGIYFFRVAIIDSWGRKSRFSKLAKLVTP